MRISVVVAAADTEVSSDFIPLEVFPEMSLDDVMGFVEAEINIKPAAQKYVLNGEVVTETSKSLAELGLNEGEMLNLLIQTKVAETIAAGQGSTSRQQPAQASPDDMSPEAFRRNVLANNELRQRMQYTHPDLFDVLEDPQEFTRRYSIIVKRQKEAAQETHRLQEMLAQDPFNIEAQEKLMEMFRLEKVNANMRKAYEENPAAFGSVTMLWIDTLVNNVPIKCFVDSGAQSTIMSKDAAEKCGIADLIDKSHAGLARGVGVREIIGRIHDAEMQLDQYSLNCTYQIMDIPGIDMLLGLDMLKRHQMCIDLKESCLRVADAKIPFLGEGDIPKFVHTDDAQVLEELRKKTEGPVHPIPTSASAVSGATTAQSTSSGSGINIRPLGSTGNVSSSHPAAAVPRQQESNASSRSAGGVDEASIAQITEKGFSRDEAIFALEQAGGNVELALGLLI